MSAKSGLQLHAWAPIAIWVTNNLHTICSCRAGKELGDIWRNTKSFTAMKIIDAIIKNSKESRKEHLLHCFITEGKKSSSNVKYKFGEHEKHPVLLDKTEMYNQKLHYIHQNPVTARFISESWHWLYSSAIDYHTAKKGRLDIIILDGFGFAKISNKETQGWSPAPGGHWVFTAHSTMPGTVTRVITPKKMGKPTGMLLNCGCITAELPDG